MKDNLVSIIIPAHNSQDTIGETIQSCLSQSWANIEVIVVDDGSTDNTIKILDGIKDIRLNVVKQENKGACAARNLGLAYSKGTYIQFLDADDLISTNKIKKQLELLHKCSENTVASCSWGRFYVNLEDFKIDGSILSKSYKNPIQWLVDSWNGKGMGQTSIWLTPSSLIRKAGPWNESLKVNQDGEFFARVLLQADEILFCPDARVFYRSSNANSISRAPFTEAKAQSLLNSYKLYVHHLPEELLTIEVRQALARNFADLIYRFNNIYPMVSQEAWIELIKMNARTFKPVGGKIFRKITSLFGFRMAVLVRKFNSYSN